MTETKAKSVKAAAETVKETATAKTKVLSTAASAVGTSAKAYVSGVTAISKAVFGIGKEVATETVEHGKASMQAKSVRTLAEMQAGYVQHRIESSTVHVKEVADVATQSFKDVYAPLMGLLQDRKAA